MFETWRELDRLAQDCQRAADRDGEVLLVTWKGRRPLVVRARMYSYRRHGVIERVRRPRGYRPPALGEW